MTVRVSVNYNDYRWKRFDLTSKVRMLVSKTVQIHQIRLSDFTLSVLACSDAKIKELRDAFKKAADKHWAGFDKDAWKDASDEEKKALREKLAASKKEWMEQMKTHRKEVGKRIAEIKEEFKNNRDKVIDNNKPGE